MGDGFLADALEGHAVEVEAVAELEVTEVEAKQGRVVAADALDVAALMDGGVVGIVGLPTDAVDGGVVLSEEVDAAVAPCLEVGQQVLGALCAPAVGQRVVGLLRLTAAAHHEDGCSSNCKQMFHTTVLHG